MHAFCIEFGQSLLSLRAVFLCLCVVILTLSLLMTTQGAFVDSVDQDQNAQNVQSDL